MRPFRVFRALVAIVALLGPLAGCTGDEPPDGGGSGTPPPTATPSAPRLDALLAAPVRAMEELTVEFPNLSIVDITEFEPSPFDDERERYGFVKGVVVEASSDNPRSVFIRFEVYGDQSGARGFLAIERDRTYVDTLLEVPGWPEVANFRVPDDGQDIWYGFVHGRATVSLILDRGRFDGPKAAAVELGAALDIVQASLDETVPVPG